MQHMTQSIMTLKSHTQCLQPAKPSAILQKVVKQQQQGNWYVKQAVQLLQLSRDEQSHKQWRMQGLLDSSQELSMPMVLHSWTWSCLHSWQSLRVRRQAKP